MTDMFLKEAESMPVKVDITRKFVVNGQEYGSIDELPNEVREAIRDSLSSGKVVDINRRGSIEFNGKEYKSASAMGPEERRLYEHALKLAGAEGCDAKEPLVSESITALQNTSEPASGNKPSFTLSFSLTPLLAVIILVIAAAALFFYLA